MQQTTSKKIKKVALDVLYPLIALGLILSVWAIASAVKGNEYLLPMPSKAFVSFFALLGQGSFWLSVGWTLARVLQSFAIAFAVAMFFALLGGLFKPIHKVLSPIVTVLRAAPTLAVILLAMIWIEYEEVAVLVGFLIAFPVLYSAFYTAVTGVDKDLIEMTKIYGVRPWDRVKSLYVPSIAPAVFDVSASTLSLTSKVVIAAEILCHTRSSIGLQMQRAQQAFEISDLMAWTLVAIVLGFALELLVKALKKAWEARR